VEHLQVALATIATATETVLPVIAEDVHRARPDMGPGYIRSLDLVSANARRIRVLPQGAYAGIEVSGRAATFVRPGNDQRIPELLLPPNGPYTVYGLQDAVGNQAVYGLLRLRYGQQNAPSPGDGQVIGRRGAGDRNSVADTWTRTHDSFWTAAGYELTEGKRYQIRGMRAFGTGLIAARLTCPEWNGMKPGVAGYATDQCYMYQFSDCPEFTHPSVVSVEALDSGAAAITVELHIVAL